MLICKDFLLSALMCHASLSFKTEHLLPPAQEQTEKISKVQKIAFCQIPEFNNHLHRNLGTQRGLGFFCVWFALFFKAIPCMEGFLMTKQPEVSAHLSTKKASLLYPKQLLNSFVIRLLQSLISIFYIHHQKTRQSLKPIWTGIPKAQHSHKPASLLTGILQWKHWRQRRNRFEMWGRQREAGESSFPGKATVSELSIGSSW